MKTAIEKPTPTAFVDTLPEGVLDGQIRAITEHAYDDSEVEAVMEYIRRQPSEFGDSGGSMASDEVPNWRDSLWGAFVSAMAVEGRTVVAIGAMAEIDHKEIRQRAALAVATIVESRMPFDGK